MPSRKGPATTEELLGDLGQRIRSLETHQHTELPDLVGRGAGGKEYATVVVAAFNTHDSGRARADLVCSGGGDEATILSARGLLPVIDGLRQGRVLLLEGNYNLTPDPSQSLSLIPFLDCQVNIEGQGRSTIIGANGLFSMFAFDIDGCSIRNLSGYGGGGVSFFAEGTGPTPSVGKIEIDNCYVGTFSSAGINVSSTGHRFRNCEFNFVEGFYLNDSNDVHIENCHVLGRSLGVLDGRQNAMKGCSSYLSAGDGVVMQGSRCVLSDCLISEAQVRGISAVSCSESIIADNVVYRCSQQADNTYDGITIGNPGFASTSHRNTVRGNVVRHGGASPRHRYGLNIATGCTDNYVQGNNLQNSGQTGSYNDAGTTTDTTSVNKL